MIRHQRWILLSLALAACSHPAPPSAATRVLRVTLRQADGKITIDAQDVVDTPLSDLPQLGGDHVLVALSHGTVVNALPFGFASTALAEGIDANGTPVSVSSPAAGAPLVVRVPLTPAFDELQVLDAMGTRVLDERPDLHPEALAIASVSAPPVPRAPDLVFLRSYAVLSPDFPTGIDWNSLPPAQQSIITTELNKLPDNLLGAIAEVGVGKAKNPALGAITEGSRIVFNVDWLGQPQFADAVVHEAAHAYTYLLDNGILPTAYGNWPPAVQAAAQQTVARYELQNGFPNLWKQTHQSAVMLKYAMDYQGSGWPNVSAADTVQGGFASAYGSRNEMEDIATFTEHLMSTRDRLAFCAQLQGTAGGDFPPSLAIPYVKIQLLANAGFVAPDVAHGCTGDIALERQPGLYFGDQIALTSGLKGGWVTQDGADFLVVLGQGDSLSGSVRVLAPGRTPPLGLHRLGSSWPFLDKANNAVYLSDERASTSGLVLVERVDPMSIRGAVFFLEVSKRASITSDYFPISTFRYDN